MRKTPYIKNVQPMRYLMLISKYTVPFTYITPCGLKVISRKNIAPPNTTLIQKKPKKAFINDLMVRGKKLHKTIIAPIRNLRSNDKTKYSSSIKTTREEAPPKTQAKQVPHLLVAKLTATLVQTRKIYVSRIFTQTKTST
jgi:hypothetical protein